MSIVSLACLVTPLPCLVTGPGSIENPYVLSPVDPHCAAAFRTCAVIKPYPLLFLDLPFAHPLSLNLSCRTLHPLPPLKYSNLPAFLCFCQLLFFSPA